MNSSVLRYMGINIDTIKGKKNVETALAGVKQDTVLKGLYDLFNLCLPGTDIEATIDLSHSQPMTLSYKFDKVARECKADAA